MKHNLKIHSLNDPKAECSCGFYFVGTSEETKQEIEKLHDSLTS